MRAFQGPFSKLKHMFFYEKGGKSNILLQFVIMLYTLRARKIGMSQILSTKMPHLSVKANKVLHDRLHILL